MASDLNQCIFIGRLGRDPEIKYSADGQAICNFWIAVNDSRKNRETGEYEDRAEWTNLVAFGKNAEFIGEWCKKGSRIAVVCKKQTREWEDRDGNKRKSVEFIVSTWHNLTPRDRSESGGDSAPAASGANGSQKGASAPAGRPAASQAAADFDDDIPF